MTRRPRFSRLGRGILPAALLLVLACRERPPDEAAVSSPSAPGRIVCASPGITEIVFGLGEGGRVVGVSDFTNHPPEANSLPRIGGFFNPNRERLLLLRPDMVITQGRHDQLARFCRERGISLVSLPMDNLSHFRRAVRSLGNILGRETEAGGLLRDLSDEMDSVRRRVEGRAPRRVFLTLGHTPGDLTGLMTTGSGTFLHEILTTAGGSNIFSDARGLYPQVSKESLVARRPEVILEVFPEGISEGNRGLMSSDWQRLPMLPAVRDGKIFFLTDDYLLIPGLRLGKIARRFAELIHPEVFEERP